MWHFFREKYNGIKDNFLNRSPKGKGEFVRDVAISILKLTGAIAINPNFKIWWYSYFPGFSSCVAFISFLYTVWYYSDDPLKGILFLPMFAIVVPSTILYVLIMIPKSRKAFRSYAYFVGEKVYPDFGSGSSFDFTQTIDESAMKLGTSTLKTVTIIVVSMIIYLIFPVVAYVRSNELHLPIPILVPFTNLETKNGIIINLSNQSSIAVMLIVGNIGIEMITCMMKNSVWAITIAISHTMKEISGMADNSKMAKDLKMKENSEKAEDSELNSEYEIDCYMRNFSIQVGDLDRFISRLSTLYYWKFFLQPPMLAVGVFLALFFHLFGIWKCGLGISLLFYAQLYILCDIGNEVDSANKLLLLKMHDMSWYFLSQKNQKTYGFVLTRLQNGAVLRMGPFDELNFATLTNAIKYDFSSRLNYIFESKILQLTKAIYSFLMMLIADKGFGMNTHRKP